MKFSQLIKDITFLKRAIPNDPEILGVSYDSRRVQKGDLFVALRGVNHDGHDHLEQAVQAGAAAVIVEKDIFLKSPYILVESTLNIMSKLSATFYDRPSASLNVIGVTGTNGKTTVTYLVEHILNLMGQSTGVIGTIEYRWQEKKEKAPNTTPVSAEIQRLLWEMKKDGVRHVAMEVSSHALDLARVDDVDFKIGVFTNLTRDHLDYHQNMESYFLAKAKLFDILRKTEGKDTPKAIINNDDSWAQKLKKRLAVPPMTYGIKTLSDVMASDTSLMADSTKFTLKIKNEIYPCKMKLVGLHNIYNALAAVSICSSLGLSVSDILKGLESVKGVPGRLERIESSSRKLLFNVFVDYAHTDDALKNVLESFRPLKKGRLITVFGCGGDRDRTKRPLMGQVAARLSDYVVITSDNPRTEDPQKITLDIEIGVRREIKENYEIVVDRQEAIKKSIDMAQEGDIVLIAGKGHEDYQVFKDKTIHFDDREVVKKCLEGVNEIK